MEEKMNGGYESHDERRDYAGNEGRRNGYSTEGRKLRPRRKVAPAASSDHDAERRPYNGNNDRRGGYQSRGGYQNRRNYSSSDNYEHNSSNRPSYGQDRREHTSYGQDRPRYNQDRRERPSYGQDRRERPGFGQDRRERPSYGQDRPHYSQDRPSYGQDRPRFRDDRQGGHSEGRPSYGKQRNFHDGSKASGFSKGPGRPAPKKPVRKNTSSFTATDEAGINQMLSRKPQVDNPLFSDNDNVPTPIKEEIRLNKFIANSGVCSRREADTLIQAGVVTVNGVVVTELGTKINVLKDDVRFNGERLKGEEKIYIVMNKPKGFVTSASDPHAEKTVMDLLKGCTSRVFPVGRLDKNTTGVLMFTNDGEIAEQLTHPSFNKKKIYQVILDKALEEDDKEKILVEGLQLTDGVIKADELEYIDAEDHRRLGIEIHSGKNRIVRRIFESLGYTVKALDRVYFAGLTKKGLKKGEWRYLSEGEVNVLKMGAYV